MTTLNRTQGLDLIDSKWVEQGAGPQSDEVVLAKLREIQRED